MYLTFLLLGLVLVGVALLPPQKRFLYLLLVFVFVIFPAPYVWLLVKLWPEQGLWAKKFFALLLLLLYLMVVLSFVTPPSLYLRWRCRYPRSSDEARRALDPNTPLGELLVLAKGYPEVLENPALPLLALEDPARCLELRRIAISSAREEAFHQYYRRLVPRLALPAAALAGLVAWLSG